MTRLPQTQSRLERARPSLARLAILLVLLLAHVLPVAPVSQGRFPGRALFPATALAQTPRERLEQELQRTDEVLLEAGEIVRRSVSERAASTLQAGVRMQETARNLMAGCQSGNASACEGAARATTLARREALRAVQIARRQSAVEQEAARVIERVGEKFDEAVGWVSENPDPRSTRLLERVRAQLERAREQYTAQQYEVALRLARTAGRLLREATDRGDVSWLSPEQVGREIERTDRLIERAGPVIREGQNDRAARFFAQGVDLQARARQELGDKRPQLAIRLTRESRERVQRALRLVAGPIDRAAVEKAIRQTQSLIDRVAPRVRASGERAALHLLETALGHQEKAREMLAHERLNPALARTRVARNLVLEARDRAASSESSEL